MSNVNTKLQDFYNRGYGDAIDQCSAFLKAIEAKFGNMTLGGGLTLGKFIVTMDTEINAFNGQRNDHGAHCNE